MIAEAWDRYLVWNQALCDVIFSVSHAGEPVYLDMDEAVLSAVAARVGVPSEDAPRQLAEVVRGTLILKSGPADVFRGHLLRLDRWRRSAATRRLGLVDILPPPTVGLLALFTLAAEAMGSDEAMPSMPTIRDSAPY